MKYSNQNTSKSKKNRGKLHFKCSELITKFSGSALGDCKIGVYDVAKVSSVLHLFAVIQFLLLLFLFRIDPFVHISSWILHIQCPTPQEYLCAVMHYPQTSVNKSVS